jgi:hypothetical protein
MHTWIQALIIEQSFRLQVLNAHYPDRVRRILVVNLPSWLGSAWSIISAVLPPSIRDKVW